MENGRCRLHGGLSPRGAAHPLTTHGRYSKYMPERLSERYAEAQADGELLSLREELALVDARIADVLQRVDTGEAGAAWKAVAAACVQYRKAEAGEKDSAFEEIAVLCQAGLQDWSAWGEVLALIERRRKIAETEGKRLATMGQMMTAERAMLLMSAVSDVITRHVTDRDTLSAIGRDVRKLMAVGSQPALEP